MLVVVMMIVGLMAMKGIVEVGLVSTLDAVTVTEPSVVDVGTSNRGSKEDPSVIERL